MAHIFYLAPSGTSVGLTSVALGLVHALDKRGMRVAFFKPIGQVQARDSGPERSTHFIACTTTLRPVTPIPLEEAERLISAKRTEELLERVVGDFRTSATRTDAEGKALAGSMTTEFDSTGFGSDCDPTAPPRFVVADKAAAAPVPAPPPAESAEAEPAEGEKKPAKKGVKPKAAPPAPAGTPPPPPATDDDDGEVVPPPSKPGYAP